MMRRKRIGLRAWVGNGGSDDACDGDDDLRRSDGYGVGDDGGGGDGVDGPLQACHSQ